MKKSQNSADSTQQHLKQGSDSSSNDHTESYIIILAEEGGGVATAAEGAENEPDADVLINRITAAVREAEEDVTMRVMLLQLIDTVIFNLAFLTVTEATVASQRCLLTRKCQNKPSTILQE
ncbi:hypothetical protein BDDG_12684 [Blastomyces dermatitidis ATCC 18188]|uniref:Uncharacterized protein n=1 Tax=Ajellomyces dermatitidis (strain ATCC 18188 / CBS 674.68) TaxID=653446 RepID=A0A0J9ESV4_AJEDA|nr:hypothetical protein BDDG_12684 [Blastomyces dermatitidis ATCC 18188]